MGALSFYEVLLQRYMLLYAQDVNRGLRDKHSKPTDFYHSCYNLSGLRFAQYAVAPWSLSSVQQDTWAGEAKGERIACLPGDATVNVVERTDPVLNIRVERVKFMLLQHHHFTKT